MSVRQRRDRQTGSDDESDMPSTSHAVRRGGYKVRRNEKGETELHRACINGDHKAVERLLLKSHPVNEKDNGGWTCLHEACNWGFIAIVRLLIEYGANLDAKGMDDLTPLLDAATNGQFEIINILLNAGASIAAVDASGRTVLDLLKAFKENADTLSEPDENEYQRITKLLEDRMRKDGIPLHQSARPQKANVSSKNHWAITRTTTSKAGVNLYKSAITTVGRSARKPAAVFDYESFTSSRRPRRGSPTKKPALVTEKEYEVADDWMIDDLNGHYIRVDSAKRPHSRGSREPSPLFSDDFESSPTRSDNVPRTVNVEDCFDTEMPDHRPSRSTIASSSSGDASDDIMLVDERPRKYRSPKKRMKQSRLAITSPAVSPAPDNDIYTIRNDFPHVERLAQPEAPIQVTEVQQIRLLSSDIVRVNIVVEGRKFAVIIDNRYHTIEWLAEKVSSSYESACGKRAVIRLYTADDAALNNSDTVEFLFHKSEELVGKVERIEVLPMEDSYRLACQQFKRDPSVDVCDLLRSAGQSTVLDLRQTCLRMTGGPADLLKALQSNYTLTALNLRGQRLTTADASELGKTLGCLQFLSNLVISCAGMHCEQLLALTAAMCQDRETRYALEKLDMSYNSLGDASAAHLSRVVLRCPRLSFLKLQCIDVNERFIKDYKASLREAFSAVPLAHLDLSRNRLGDSVDELQSILNGLDRYVELKLY